MIEARHPRLTFVCAIAIKGRTHLPGVEHCRGYIQSWWGAGNPIPERSAQRVLKASDQTLKAGAVSASAEGQVAGLKAAIYARVSTLDQEPENQLQEPRRYVQARGWTAVEYVDRGQWGEGPSPRPR